MELDPMALLQATMDGYTLARAKLAKLEQDYKALAEQHNLVIDQNKELIAKSKEKTPKKKGK